MLAKHGIAYAIGFSRPKLVTPSSTKSLTLCLFDEKMQESYNSYDIFSSCC